MILGKVAVVHEWLVTCAGSEKALAEILGLFPQADVFTLIDFLPNGQRDFLEGRRVTTSFIQKLPFARRRYRDYLPLMPFAVEQFDLSDYDIVISSSHAVAKGVLTRSDQLHISYVYSPMRYAWDLQNQYLSETDVGRRIKGLFVRWVLHKIRIWDRVSANGVDEFVAISRFIAARIRKIYRRRAQVIYPPVDVSRFSLCVNKEEFYLTVSRLVPYKRVLLIVKAFAGMPDKRLVVIGDGPDYKRIAAVAPPNVELLGYQDDAVVHDYMQRARAFLFAAQEDFGITPLEAQACGTAVIALGKGGSQETIRGLDSDSPTGVLFDEQTVEAIQEAVGVYEERANEILPQACRENAFQFSGERFREAFMEYVRERWSAFVRDKSGGLDIGCTED